LGQVAGEGARGPKEGGPLRADEPLSNPLSHNLLISSLSSPQALLSKKIISGNFETIATLFALCRRKEKTLLRSSDQKARFSMLR
jgi:hypothetical protein